MAKRKNKKKKKKTDEIKIRKTWGMNPVQKGFKTIKTYKRSDNKKYENGED
jgi:hypothetical protein